MDLSFINNNNHSIYKGLNSTKNHTPKYLTSRINTDDNTLLDYTFRQHKKRVSEDIGSLGFLTTRHVSSKGPIKFEVEEKVPFLKDYIQDLNKTLTLNLDMLNKFIEKGKDLSTNSNNKDEECKSIEIINKLNQVVSLHKSKEKSYSELITLKGKILLDQQVEEDLKRSVSEVENSYLEQIEELEEGNIKKDGVLLQNEKKFNEVEVYIRRECVVDKKYHKYKKYEILPFLREHQEFCVNIFNLNKSISNYKFQLSNIEKENKLILEEIEIGNLNTTKPNDEMESNMNINNKDYIESLSKRLKGTNEILSNNSEVREKQEESLKKKNKKSFSLINFNFFKSKPKEEKPKKQEENLQEKVVPIALPNNNEKIQFNLSSNFINTQNSKAKLALSNNKNTNQNQYEKQNLNSTYKDKIEDNGKDNSIFNLFKRAFRSGKDNKQDAIDINSNSNSKLANKGMNYKKKSKQEKLFDILTTKITYLNSIVSQKKDLYEKQNFKTEVLSTCNEKIKDFINIYDDYLKNSKLISNKLDNGDLNLNQKINSDKNSLSITDDQQIKHDNDDLNLNNNTNKDSSTIIENKLIDLIMFLEESKLKIISIDEKINAMKNNNQISFKEIDYQYESENIDNLVSQFGLKKLQYYDYEKEYNTYKNDKFFNDINFTSNLFDNDINKNINTLQSEILNNTINLEDSYVTDGSSIRNAYQSNTNDDNWEISMIRSKK